VGKLLPGGRYQADDGFVYPSYQAAANRGQDLQAIQNASGSILRGLSNPLGLINQSLGAINQYEAARRGGFGGGRSAAAAEQPPGRPEGTQAILGKKPVQWAIENGKGSWVKDYQNEGDIMREMLAEQAAKRAANQAGSSATLDLRGAPPAPILPVPITSPNTTFQNADDEYNRLKSQFGGATGVSQLAGMSSLPTGFTPTGGKQAAGLKDYYAAQQEVGERNIGEITSALAASDPRYQKGGAFEKWAIANPDLAMREFNKKFPTGAPTQGPSDDAIRAAISGGKFYPSEGSPSPVTNPPDFGTPANGVPADPRIQGRAVSAPYDAAQAMAAQKTAGATGMPQFQTSQPQPPGKNYLDAFRNTPWSEAFVNTLGGMAIRKLQGL